MASATEAVLLVRAVAERLVARAAAATKGGLLALVENGAFGVEDPNAPGDEQWPVRGCAKLERLLPLRRWDADPAGSQGARWTTRDRRLDLVGRRRVDLDPRPPAVVEHLRQRTDAVLRVVTEPRLPLDDDLVGRVLLREVVPLRARSRRVHVAPIRLPHSQHDVSGAGGGWEARSQAPGRRLTYPEPATFQLS